MEDFLIEGVTTAVLNDAGTVPFLRDVLHRAVRNGDRRSLHSLSSHIGSGSNQDCLFGASWISFETSAGVTGSNDESWVTLTSRYWGGGADCVMLRTFSTLDVKKAEKSYAENDDELSALLRPRTVSIRTSARDERGWWSSLVVIARTSFSSAQQGDVMP